MNVNVNVNVIVNDICVLYAIYKYIDLYIVCQKIDME